MFANTLKTTPSRRPSVMLMLLVGLTASCSMLTCQARAQNALGNGRALENKLQTYNPNARYPSQRDNFAREMLFRESIVTGTAPGGLSFQGSTLPSRFEFRGDLGEDNLFAFRRDSLYSGLAGRGIRGTEALQYQFALTTGGRVPNTLTGMISYARPGGDNRTTSPIGAIQPQTFSPTSPTQPGPRKVTPDEDLLLPSIQTGSSLIAPVRSLSSYAANRSMQPTLVGVSTNPVTHENIGQTASPLLGVQNIPVAQLRNPETPATRPPASPSSAQPASATPGKLLPSSANPGRVTPGLSSTPNAGLNTTTTPSKPVKTAYDELIGRYRDLAGVNEEPGTSAQANSGLPAWASDIVSLRKLLRGLPPSTAQAMGITPETTGDGTEHPVQTPDMNMPDEAADNQARSITGRPGIDKPETLFQPEVLARIRQAGGMTNTLIPTNIPTADRYSAYMQHGQTLLAQGRYFDAEESFISAMSSRPDDINAAVGRIHAQLGAGLYLSAALNLRQLLFAHPEIAGMRYGSNLLPDAAREEVILQTLTNNLKSPISGADNGLLLAYLAFQLGNHDDLVAQGLDTLQSKGDKAAGRLAVMLKGIWLDQTTANPPENTDTTQNTNDSQSSHSPEPAQAPENNAAKPAEKPTDQ